MLAKKLSLHNSFSCGEKRFLSIVPLMKHKMEKNTWSEEVYVKVS